ncbi:hypothetical protein HPB47_010542 [Ixodes persulcatus]|uniref:Uncharacterized protein n=1 Tax=Ixodes persulcatus TaxID=34615 RepID=A0AC60NYU1_IXOPE|nr:hypothetical protein HPB47_010542 [Ixodes persulcatus]
MGPHRGGIDSRERHRRRRRSVAGLPVPLPIPKRSGSSAADQDGGSHPPAAWTRLQASNTWHPVADPSCGPVPTTSSSHPVTDPVTVPVPHGLASSRPWDVVVINGVGLPDTRNHEAEFPEGAGSPLPILGSSPVYSSLGGVFGLLVLGCCCVCICRMCCGRCRRDRHITVVNAAPTSPQCMRVTVAPTIVNSAAPATAGPAAPLQYAPVPMSDPGLTSHTYCPTAPPQPLQQLMMQQPVQQPQAPWVAPPKYAQ